MSKRQLRITRTNEDFMLDEENPIKPAAEPFQKAKVDFSYFLQLQKTGDGVLMMTYDLFCNKKNWLEDSSSLICRKCKKSFGLFLRRHHCRCCGQIFCWECLKYSLILSKLGNQSINEETVQAFVEGFNCVYNKENSSLLMKICNDCFSTNLDELLKDINQGTLQTKVRNTPKRFSFSQSIIRQRVLHQVSKELAGELFQRITENSQSLEFSESHLVEIVSQIFNEFE